MEMRVIHRPGLKLFRAALTATIAMAALQVPGHSQTASRRLYVSATNDSGAQVVDLNASEFELREGGQKRDISRVALAQRPMRVALLVDTSNSAVSVVQQIRGALRAFFDAIDPQHEIVLITTGGMLRVRVPPTTDREKLKAESDRLFTDGANVLLTAVVESYNRFLRSGEFYPILAVITLGDLGSGTYPDNRQLDRLGKDIRANTGTVLGAILRLHRVAGAGGFDSGSSSEDHSLDVDICHTLAKATDGSCMEIMTAAALEDATKQLAGRINENYRSSPPAYEVEYGGVGKGGTPQVQVTRPGVHVEILSSR